MFTNLMVAIMLFCGAIISIALTVLVIVFVVEVILNML